MAVGLLLPGCCFTLKPQRLQQWLRAGAWAAGNRQSYLPATPEEIATGFEGFAFCLSAA